ncbi:MAG: protein translocase subunit SecF [Anaerolineales bacterium]|nr:protein translocase subunit SecF [Anaerolineales bacterium]MDD5468459.1 protein translocase subunit SecF [Anaerolineales bacterium]
MIDILGKRYYFFALSLLVIVPGLIVMAIWKLPLAIDFTGGSLLEVSFEGNRLPQPADVVLLYNTLGVEDVQVQTTGQETIVAKSSFLDDDTRGKIVTEMEQAFGTKVTVLRFESVGPTVGKEVTLRAGLAVAIAALGVILYITFAFRGVQHAFRYGLCAIIAMVHDVAVVVSLSAIGGLLWGWQVDSLFLTALLTVIGFSVQDKIVVFDRVRENSNLLRRLSFEKLVNHSIIQTLQRSINTQLMTVEFMLLALALFGGVTLREFAVILLVGLFSGTYSSIFIAAPILVAWENREWRNWFGRGPRQAAA